MPTPSYTYFLASLPAPSFPEEAATALPVGRDLALADDGDLDITTGDLQLVSGSAAVKQELNLRLNFWKETWFLDATAGIPVLQNILVRNPDLVLIDFFLRKEMSASAGVASVQKMGLAIDSERKLTGDYEVVTDTSKILTGAVVLGSEV